MDAAAIEGKAAKLVASLTLEEKIALCSGADFWHTKAMSEKGIPAAMMCDGPHGLRVQDEQSDMLGINDSIPATCFPTASLTACSFDTDLMERMGAAIGREALMRGVGMVLGPGANIKRNPLCGRNFEYFSEDPLLSGKMAAAFVRGVQSTGTAACLKHFALNNQEKSRFNSDSLADERTMREIYLASFERAVREGHPAAVMSSYNKVNGIHSSCNAKLLDGILRGEWGFDGMVVTDWGGLADRSAAFEAGCDLAMPGGSAYGEKEAAANVREGSLDERRVDDAARRVTAFALAHERMPQNQDDGLLAGHFELAREVAEQSVVLLKNDGNLLPLDAYDVPDFVIVGAMAASPRYQGAGSSHINPWRLESMVHCLPEATYVAGCNEDGSATAGQLEMVRAKARGAKAVIVCAGLPANYESEGFDRKDMRMPAGHRAMIEAASDANENVIVVLSCGSAVEVPWIDSVKAVLYAGLSGEAGARACVNVLLGVVNPSGKIAESWPMRYEDCASSIIYGEKQACYREGIYVGYRYYQKAGLDVRFPFGHGLSYTSFAFENLEIKPQESGYLVSFDVENTGDVRGSEVAQVYVAYRGANEYRSVRELGGFAKVILEPGQNKRVSVLLDERAFATWADGGWVVAGGTYEVQVGSSCEDIRLSQPIDITGPKVEDACADWYRHPVGKPSAADFEGIYGRVEPRPEPRKGSFTMDNTIAEMAPHSLVMRLVENVIKLAFALKFRSFNAEDNPEHAMFLAATNECTLSGMKINAGMSNGLFEGLLALANGRGAREGSKKGRPEIRRR